MCMHFKTFLIGILTLGCLSAYGQDLSAASLTDTLQAGSTKTFVVTSPLLCTEPLSYPALPVTLTLPAYTQGAFCDLEDAINRNRKLRIDLNVK